MRYSVAYRAVLLRGPVGGLGGRSQEGGEGELRARRGLVGQGRDRRDEDAYGTVVRPVHPPGVGPRDAVDLGVREFPVTGRGRQLPGEARHLEALVLRTRAVGPLGQPVPQPPQECSRGGQDERRQAGQDDNDDACRPARLRASGRQARRRVFRVSG
ncbi:hypothetical protein ACH4LT_22475 [Streptomyces clavifer]|uniref:hypothetical protein n=1 Tax=Streptomyces clavifer TaxID=68188 RepID=UPI0037A68ABF